jgi:hypothetical protein
MEVGSTGSGQIVSLRVDMVWWVLGMVTGIVTGMVTGTGTVMSVVLFIFSFSSLWRPFLIPHLDRRNRVLVVRCMYNGKMSCLVMVECVVVFGNDENVLPGNDQMCCLVMIKCVLW